MPKIYTKTGDSGETSLLGKRVEKSCLEIVALGEVDELNASIGVLISFLGCHSERPEGASESRCRYDKIIKKLINVQHNLFVIGSNIAAVDLEIGQVPKLKNKDSVDLENWIDEMEKDLEPLHNFILPGGCQASAQSFFARAVCRRAERVFISVKKQYPDIDQNIGKYLNRLSDVLFVLARWLNKENGCKDTVWKK